MKIKRGAGEICGKPHLCLRPSVGSKDAICGAL